MSRQNRLTATAVLSFYNKHQFIDETIASLERQTRLFDEIIIVDDGSDDLEAKAKIVSLSKDQRFRVLSQENAGVCAALTLGARCANGDIVFEVDPDDVLESTYVEKYMRVFDDHAEIDMVTSGYYSFFDGDDYTKTQARYHAYMPEGYTVPDQFFHNCICASNTAFRKKALELVGYWPQDFKGPQDWGIGLSFYKNKMKMHVIPEYLYLYRIHKTGFAQRIEKQHDISEALRRAMGEILESNPDHYLSAEYETMKAECDANRRKDAGKNRKMDARRLRLHMKEFQLTLKREGLCKTVRRLINFLFSGKGTL